MNMRPTILICLLTAGALACGCVPLPGQKPTTLAEVGDGYQRVPIDPRRVCGECDSGRAIRPGASRAAVRHLLRGVPHEPPWRRGDTDAPAEEIYRFRNEARVLLVAPNPEGGLIGLLPRSLDYTLHVRYDESGRVRDCRVVATGDVTSPHPVWSMP